MKKNFVLILFLILFQTTAFAAVKSKKDITLDFTLNYRNTAAGKASEHTMKDAVHIVSDKWHVAGKFITNKDDEVILFLVRLTNRKTSKFTFQFMIIDSDSKSTFISEPKMTTMAGLPSQMTISGDGRAITLNALVNLTDKH